MTPSRRISGELPCRCRLVLCRITRDACRGTTGLRSPAGSRRTRNADRAVVRTRKNTRNSGRDEWPTRQGASNLGLVSRNSHSNLNVGGGLLLSSFAEFTLFRSNSQIRRLTQHRDSQFLRLLQLAARLLAGDDVIGLATTRFPSALTAQRFDESASTLLRRACSCFSVPVTTNVLPAKLTAPAGAAFASSVSLTPSSRRSPHQLHDHRACGRSRVRSRHDSGRSP